MNSGKLSWDVERKRIPNIVNIENYGKFNPEDGVAGADAQRMEKKKVTKSFKTCNNCGCGITGKKRKYCKPCSYDVSIGRYGIHSRIV